MTPSSPAFHAIQLFNGVAVHLIQKEQLLAFLISQSQQNTKTLVNNHNLHSVFLYHRLPEFRKSHQLSSLTHIDGMPLVFWGKFLGYPCTRKHRLTYLDWAPDLLREMELQHLRLAVLGGKPENLDRSRKFLQATYPSLEFQLQHGYFDAEDDQQNQSICSDLNQFRPHIVMVGMGMPRQELWIANHFHQLPESVILPCGAFFDYLNGSTPTPNRTCGRIGLEWFARLRAEPRRLAGRYLLEPWLLFPEMFKDLVRIRHHHKQAKEIQIALSSE